jgi:hypothetical protein
MTRPERESETSRPAAHHEQRRALLDAARTAVEPEIARALTMLEAVRRSHGSRRAV